ncbi:MAG: HRDC domain-containing protein [Glutamicibacter arilaitensis]|uniref:Ribonuclease D n=2 Tax=Glutamicibacter arilaitensis TaxID=256701 RepID=A0A2N7S3B6_9MICC|nr:MULTISPECIES: HRDC domain-containing protein [Glutamicibacter]PMQ20642.1 ribonuclease D [Glutamicibacter arilaitensis]CBT76203.1 putative ribonuclease D [Glutamicibacter arilaitensis Re117]HCH48000.1 ribonuclease D [Glutamicibacter sp.]HCJ54811.1 ribonuclease D [Glutamicibacter sp.]
MPNSDSSAPASSTTAPEADQPVLTPLTEPRDGIPEVIDTAPALRRAVRALEAGTGDLAVDTERASGFRYGQRAFLLQIRREGSGTWLVDPETLDDLSPLRTFVNAQPWILHAATQDLPCLHELGMSPTALFDTELAGRLAGFPRVSLGTMVGELLGLQLAKEHSAVDWSTRPLPESWLNYAALDVEVLEELRQAITATLEEQGKLEFAIQEFEHERNLPDPVPADTPWRKLSGIHKLKSRRNLAIARELWLSRESLARSRDVAPGRLIPDRAIMAAVEKRATSVPALLQIPGFHTRNAKRDAARWVDAIQRGQSTKDLPDLRASKTGLPHPRAWAEKNPAAANRLEAAKLVINEVSEHWNIPGENLLTPKYLRELCWNAPTRISETSVREKLQTLGARAWQRDLISAKLAEALKQS